MDETSRPTIGRPSESKKDHLSAEPDIVQTPLKGRTPRGLLGGP